MSIFKSLAKSHSLFSHLAKVPSLYIEVYFNRLAKPLSIFPSPSSSLFPPLLPPDVIPIYAGSSPLPYAHTFSAAAAAPSRCTSCGTRDGAGREQLED